MLSLLKPDNDQQLYMFIFPSEFDMSWLNIWCCRLAGVGNSWFRPWCSIQLIYKTRIPPQGQQEWCCTKHISLHFSINKVFLRCFHWHLKRSVSKFGHPWESVQLVNTLPVIGKAMTHSCSLTSKKMRPIIFFFLRFSVTLFIIFEHMGNVKSG